MGRGDDPWKGLQKRFNCISARLKQIFLGRPIVSAV